MTESLQNQSPYRRGADHGFSFAIYLTAMFFASIYSSYSLLLGMLCVVMMLSVPFVIYSYQRRSYLRDNGRTILSSLWVEGITTFFCGSLLSGIIQVIYLKWIDPGFILSQMQQMITLYRDSGLQNGTELADLLQQLIDNHAVPSAISIVIEMIWLAVFSGSLLSVLMALLVRAKPIPDSKR